jgi:hypothetical protein
MPLLLPGLRKKTSLFCFHVAGCTPASIPPTTEVTARCAGDWIQELKRLGYRKRFLPMKCAPKETLPPLGVWSHALALDGILPDVIFEVLRFKPRLVPMKHTSGDE